MRPTDISSLYVFDNCFEPKVAFGFNMVPAIPPIDYEGFDKHWRSILELRGFSQPSADLKSIFIDADDYDDILFTCETRALNIDIDLRDLMLIFLKEVNSEFSKTFLNHFAQFGETTFNQIVTRFNREELFSTCDFLKAFCRSEFDNHPLFVYFDCL